MAPCWNLRIDGAFTVRHVPRFRCSGEWINVWGLFMLFAVHKFRNVLRILLDLPFCKRRPCFIEFTSIVFYRKQQHIEIFTYSVVNILPLNFKVLVIEFIIIINGYFLFHTYNLVTVSGSDSFAFLRSDCWFVE